MPRLVTNPISTRSAGRYDLTPGGIAVPRSNFAELRIRRPRTDRGEDAWISRGSGGVAQSHRENNGDIEVGYGGLDTEVMRAYLFLSEDAGSSWIPYGHVATEGGDLFDRRGDLITHTSLRIELPIQDNPDRRLQVVLRCNEELRTEVWLDVNSDIRPGTSLSTHRSLALEASAGAGAAGASTVSSASITPAGDRRFLVVFGANEDNSVAAYSNIQYNGSNITQLFTDAWTYYRVSCATQTAPSTGGGTCSYTVASSQEGICVGGLAFSDVNQTTPTDTAPAAVTGSTNPSMTIAAGDAGDWRIAAVSGDGSYTVGANETSRIEVENIGTYNTSLVISTKSDGGSDAMNWSGGSFGFIMRGFNMNEDTGASGTIVNRTLSDSLAVTDPSDVLRERNRLQQDELAVAEFVEYFRVMGRLTVDDITVSDATDYFRVMARVDVSAAEVEDFLVALRQRFRVLSDYAALDYSAETIRKRVVEIFDTWIGVSDSLVFSTGQFPVSAILTDTIAVGDDVEMLRQRIRILADTLAVEDALLPVSHRLKVLADVLTVTDDVNLTRDRFIDPDTLDVTDSSLELRQRFRVVLDSLAALDAAVSLRQRFRLLQDAIAVTDSVDPTYVPDPGAGVRILTDAIDLLDFVETLRLRYRTLSDELVTVDSSVELRDRFRELADALEVNDTLAFHGGRLRGLADSIDVSDENAIMLRSRVRELSDYAELTDTVLVTYIPEGIIVLTVTTTDNISLIDSVTATVVYTTGQFFIKHDVEAFDIDHDVEFLHILHDVKKET